MFVLFHCRFVFVFVSFSFSFATTSGFTPIVEIVNCNQSRYCVMYNTAARRNTQTFYDMDFEATIDVNCLVEGG